MNDMKRLERLVMVSIWCIQEDSALRPTMRKGLPSNLHELEIRNCNQLTPQVDWGLQRLASLTRLSIECGCEDVDLFPNKYLLPSSLTSLVISKLPNLKSLNSKGLQQLTFLLKLEISSYPEPHCFAGSVFQHPISLKVLRICDCPSSNR
ncbi:unnamed protein product, partial [Vitis vinifera]|uniref:Uncharacterized protein n=1 Tax=Vitis vinifera TaxID=29760 RepID=D7TNV7_VITVI